MTGKWFYTPQGEPALYQHGNHIWDREVSVCLYWEENGWWFSMKDRAPAFYVGGRWVCSLDGEPAYYAG